MASNLGIALGGFSRGAVRREKLNQGNRRLDLQSRQVDVQERQVGVAEGRLEFDIDLASVKGSQTSADGLAKTNTALLRDFNDKLKTTPADKRPALIRVTRLMMEQNAKQGAAVDENTRQLGGNPTFNNYSIPAFEAAIVTAQGPIEAAEVAGGVAATEAQAKADTLAANSDFTREQILQKQGDLPTPEKPEAINPINIQMPDGSLRGFDPRDPELKTALAAGGVEVGLSVQATSTSDLLPGKKATGELETGLIAAGEGLARLEEIKELFEPEFLELPSKIALAGLNQAERLGFDISDENKERLTRYAAFTRRAISNLNLHIKEITGAQMSEPEANRLRKGVPDPQSDGPTQFIAKLDDSIIELRAAAFRKRRLRRLGFEGDITERQSEEFPLSEYKPPADEPQAVLTDADEDGNPIFTRPDGSKFKMILDAN